MNAPALTDIQKRFFSLIRLRLDDNYRMRPLPETGEHSKAELRDMIKPNERLSAEQRIELYARQYWFRIVDNLYDDFPGVARLLGVERFHDLVLAYLDAHPSRAWTLRRLGQFFPEYVTRPEAPVPKALRRVVVDMARLEWAKMEAFDAAELEPLAPDDALGGDILNLSIGLQPHIHLLELGFPVDSWLVQLKREEWRAGASNAVAAEGPLHEGGDEPPMARLEVPPRSKTRVAVHRHAERIYFKRLPAEAFDLLSAFADGRPLGEALDDLMPASGKSGSWWHAHIMRWFAEWTALHWLTPVE